MTRRHPLLAHQLAKATGDDGAVDLSALLAMVDAAYVEADQWRHRTDRAALLMCEEMEELNAELRQLAHHDTLTGLPNRAYLIERLEQALGLSRQEGKRVAVLYLDLDHFKEVNDTLGHAVGDDLLRVAADRLKAAIRAGDTLARLGGDEFAVVQTDIAVVTDCETLARRLIEVLEPAIALENNAIRIGVAISDPVSLPTGPQLMRSADVALYQVKNRHRGGWCIFDPEAGMAITLAPTQNGAALPAFDAIA
ncbi:GGDEF domain-containing protein [Xanthobacteraceae bacterium Astr-EGSB]|uniref:diguanylate cyclase domain-containing protein n=1 Tax=Astrobacterium formosum TaxID=3069710 RepID=UPI0027ADC66B|nr:GGDEF domain-containing protein [Xanthobacteraceae bacterium Astr-EGSB]